MGMKVGGRKSELIDRLLEENDVLLEEGKPPAAAVANNYSNIPNDAVVILACKSWGLFQRSALSLEKILRETDPSLLVFGHPRGKGKNAWNPIDLKIIPGELKTSPKGMFQVQIGGSEPFGTTIVTVGPEVRPFESLRATDMNDIAKQVLEALNEV